MLPLQFHRILIAMLGIGLLTGCQTTASKPSQTIVVPEATTTKQTTVSTATPIPPTLPPDETTETVLSLLADNQNPDCLLPCWWGVTPGQTQWQEVESFLTSFAIKSETTPIGASVKFPLHESILVPGFDYDIVYIWDEFGVINEIDIDPLNITGYDPQTMMGLYGAPDEVWLLTSDAPFEGLLPFRLILVYQQKGISFNYYIDATLNGEIITACFGAGVVEEEQPDLFPTGPRIYVWESSQPKTIDEIANSPETRYFSLETKTELTPQTLYEKFTAHPDEPTCIDTPADLWWY